MARENSLSSQRQRLLKHKTAYNRTGFWLLRMVLVLVKNCIIQKQFNKETKI